MKRNNIKSLVLKAILPLCVLTSCSYLDVIPPEQPEASDTMKDENSSLGFLYSCYIAVDKSAPFPYNTFEQSVDEAVAPPLWGERSQKTAWNLWSASNPGGNWDECYNFIGQCHMFLQQLELNNPVGVTPEKKDRWRAEAEFLKAYYHARLLPQYGPIPIMDQRLSQNVPTDEIPGRSHYDYIVDYIVNKLDESAKVLPAFCAADEWGRGTSTACKAIKARVLLHAASDLWNGKFPYSDWKNSKYETPGYGTELVSHTYSAKKWERALEANLDALNYAEKEGQRKLLDLETALQLASAQRIPLPYVPGVDDKTPEGKLFLQRVLLMRYLMNTYETDGNQETIWGSFLQDASDGMVYWPKRVLRRSDSWVDGWCATSPTLYTVEHFYTADGKLPEQDPTFAPKNEWLTSAKVADRSEIIKLNTGREPRFYAWLSFDGDDYSSLIAAGQPLRVNLRDSQKQGYNPDAYFRDYCVTGYFSKKFVQPDINCGQSNSNNGRKYARPLFRLAELYLNVAECYAALGNTQGVLDYLNPIRKRAGIPELEESDITTQMSAMDWVRNERFAEMWSEGQRYSDLRRWMTAPEHLKANAREGLDMNRKVNPSFEELNKRIPVDQLFQWANRMYLLPIRGSEIYSNPQLVQSPEY